MDTYWRLARSREAAKLRGRNKERRQGVDVTRLYIVPCCSMLRVSGNTSWMWHTGLSSHLRQQACLHTNKLVDGWIPGFSLGIMASPFRGDTPDPNHPHDSLSPESSFASAAGPFLMSLATERFNHAPTLSIVTYPLCADVLLHCLQLLKQQLPIKWEEFLKV